MSKVRKSLAYSSLDSYLGIGLQILSTVIIARILTPEETGIFAVAAVFAALASTFRDFGVAEYLIQARELSGAQIRAALTVNIAVSWTVSALLWIAAPVAGDYYGQDAVADVMRIQAVNFVLIPFGAVTQAWYRRELDYRPIVMASLSANVAAFGVTVSLALAGFGPLALAWGSLTGCAVTVIVMSLQRPPGFPRLPGWRGVAEVFHFGKFASGVYIVAQAGKGAPELIIGRALGLAEAGMFSRARGLVELFLRIVMRPVMQVCLPYFAQAKRESGSITQAYLRSVALLTAVGWPFVGFFAVAAYPLVRIVYGDQWLAAVPAAQLLCLACVIELPFMLAREALLAVGHVRRASLLQVQIVVLQLVGIGAGLPWGLVGAATGMLVAAVLGALAAHWQLSCYIELQGRELWRACRSSAGVALAALAAPYLATLAWPPSEANFWWHGLGGGAMLTLAWCVALRALGHPMWSELVAQATSLRRKLRRSP